jgi:uncharacterized protein with GYD domain
MAYFEFGDRDAFSIVDLPDDEAAAAVSLIASTAGGATVRTTVLLTPEQVNEAANRAVNCELQPRETKCRRAPAWFPPLGP